MNSDLIYEVDDQVATITLNRARARNALNRELLTNLVRTMEMAEADPKVAVVIITGSDPAFCAGLDLKDLESGDLDLPQLTSGGVPWPVHRKPWIGAINGVAVTGGLELALACDLLVVSQQASFVDTHLKVGILPFWCMTSLLPEAVGVRVARWMSVTNSPLSAQRAFELGMASLVVPHEELMASAHALARDVLRYDSETAQALFEGYALRDGAPSEAGFAREQVRALRWQGPASKRIASTAVASGLLAKSKLSPHAHD